MQDEPALEASQDMKFETASAADPILEASKNDDGSTVKRAREDDDEEAEKQKKPKVDNEIVEKKEGLESGAVSAGPKTFYSSEDMFEYFYKILHFWTPNLNINKYEHMALLELLKKGHLEPEKKIGNGIKAFQVRYHPQFKSRCFFLVREDESIDDFSFRKCVDHILPLPENMQIKHDVNKALRGKGGGHGRGRGRGRGRGGRN
ncbi:unnamed protein product [Fraxinus pennsylvanica]|uniref:Uncharacterized protein n=1 Tax=Fraxinus pennsylvanica TaxID=56036 RepID=A0AAD1YMI7_9LAMI|nr:unnamed protein product [Fraxinus pennsylvanica]